MRKLIVTAVVAAVASGIAGAGVVMAAQTFTAFNHEFTYDAFQPQQLDVTVATEKATGHKMNLVKLKNGHMMALVPADRYVGMMTTPSDDMVQ